MVPSGGRALPLMAFSIAIALSITARQLGPPAEADPALAPLCAQVLRAAEQRDFALLLPVLSETVKFVPEDDWIKRHRVPKLVQVWPEDFGPAFWRDLRDVVQSGVRDNEYEYNWRSPGIFVAFRRTKGEWQITAIVRRTEPRTSLLPVDVAASEPGLAGARAQIKRAIARRDMETLLPVVAPQIKVGERRYSPREFVDRFRAFTRETGDEFWRRLHDAISLGLVWYGSTGRALASDSPWDDDVFAPYPYIKLMGPKGLEDLVITAEGVALRSAPDENAATIESLSYHVVKKVPGTDRPDDSRPVRIDGFKYGWRRVISPSGKTGWVVQKYVWGATGDPALRFTKIDGTWKLASIMAVSDP